MRARIDGEGCCFCRQRLVTLNRLFMPDELKNLQNFLVKCKFHIFYRLNTFRVEQCSMISVCAV